LPIRFREQIRKKALMEFFREGMGLDFLNPEEKKRK
jgi:hypothetical protein